MGLLNTGKNLDVNTTIFMKSNICVFFMLFAFISLDAQTSINKEILNIQNFLYTNSYYKSKADVKLWVNKAETQIEIGYAKFNLNDIRMSYSYHEQDRVHLVGFMCKEGGNCIEMRPPLSDEPFANGYYLGFKTKKNCYDFMELLGALRRKLNRANGF